MKIEAEFKTIQTNQFSMILRACQIVARIDIAAIKQSIYGNGLSVNRSIMTPDKQPKKMKYGIM